MTNTIDLHQMDLLPLTEGEIFETDGGMMPWWGALLIGAVISNWDDCVDGFRDGWNAY